MPSNRLAVGVAVTAAALSTTVLAPAAEATNPQLPRVSIKASDYRVSSGEQFVVRGKLRLGYGPDEIPAPPSTVQLQTKHDGDWENLTGARVTSNEDGRYRVRVVLGMAGKRKLRAHTKTPKFRKWVNSRSMTVRVS